MKKIISFMLSAVITLTLFCVDVQAATVVVKTEDELRDALKNNGKVILGSDIIIKNGIYLNNSFSLDMNGYDIIFDESYGESAVFSVMDINSVVEIVDTVGGGSFRNKNDSIDGELILEVKEAEIVGVDVSKLYIYSGTNKIANAKIGYFNCLDIFKSLEVKFYGNVSADKMILEGGTYNFDPSDMLYTGMVVIDNDDGTYTIRFKKVEELNVTQKIYFDNFIDEDGQYYFSDSESVYDSAHELVLEVYYVTGNCYINLYFDMVPEDLEGKLWSVEIDKAYANAFCGIFAEDGFAEDVLFVMPNEDEAVVHSGGNVTLKVEEPELPNEIPSESITEEPTQTPTEIPTEIPTEQATDIVINENQTDEMEQNDEESKAPNEDLPYIVGVVCFGIVAVISIIVVIAYKKKQESSL